jgi:hypothetical protein
MADYRQEQDWLMDDLEASQHFFEQKEIEDTIAGIDRKMRSRIVKHMRLMAPKLFAKVPAKECFERWKAGYRLQKPAAIKILKDVRDGDLIDLD